MTGCPKELEWSMYVDGASAREDAEKLDAHLAGCAACRTLRDALVAERRALTGALTLEDEAVVVPPFEASAATHGPLNAAALLIGLAASAFVLPGLLVPRWLEPFAWLNPFTPAAIADLVLGALVFIAMEGRSMLTSAVQTAAATVLVSFIVALAVIAARRGGRGAAVFSAALAAIVFSSQSQALEIRRSEGLVSVTSAETIDDTLFAFGQNIEIDGVVTGDLIAFGNRVVIRGRVEGQLVTGARTVDIEGVVGGSVLGFAETLSVPRGEISRNLFGFGRRVTSGSDAQLGGNAVVFASDASLGSSVTTDVVAFVGELEVSSQIGGDLTAYAGSVRVLGPARIDGDIIAHVARESDVQVSQGASVGGTVQTEVRDADPDEQPGAARRVGGFLASQLVRFGGAFATGLVLLWLVPPLRRLSVDNAGETVTAAGIGLIALVAVPIIALMTAVTLIGLPIAVLGVLVWIVGLYVAKIVLAHVVGQKLFERAGRPAHFALVLAVGLLLVFLAINLPLLGALFNFLLTITGLGMLVIFLWGVFQGRPLLE